ncbi:MAG: nicotinate-nucleotide adenylyltransferase [Arenicella sp.]|jgi:nicotinate-nucleotide adenylyltransferase
MVESPRLIGIFGGTFDPIHLGHLHAIQMLGEQVSFDAVHWVLSARPPHKDKTSATVEHRFKMMQLAMGDLAAHIADDTEIKRVAQSYTVDTVEMFQARYLDAQICVIIGGDSLLSLPSWHRYDELLEMVNWAVMSRPGYHLDLPQELRHRLVSTPDQLNNGGVGKIWVFEHSEFDISSTQLRAELATPSTENLSKVFLPKAVFSYIREQQLYKIAPMKPEQIKDQVVDALEDIKGVDIRVIDITDISDFADFMVVASGTSDTHVKALARSASTSLRTQGVIPLNEDGGDVGEWVLVDFGDVVLHVMRPEVREYYDLEKLWDKDVRALMKKHREEQDGV